MTVVLITNGDCVAGRDTAHKLFYLGADVIVGTQCSEKGTALIRYVQSHRLILTIPPREGTIDFIILDLDDLRLVKQSITQLVESPKHVDILINNNFSILPKAQTINGFDRQTQHNYLSTFMITLLLIPKMKSSPGKKQIINTVNAVHAYGILNLEDLRCNNQKFIWELYFTHNLMLVTMMRMLEKKISDQSITVHFVHIHVRETNIIGTENMGLNIRKILKKVQGVKLDKLLPDQCSKSLLKCVTDKSDKNTIGNKITIEKYYQNGEVRDLPGVGLDKSVQSDLWTKTLELFSDIKINYTEVVDAHERSKRLNKFKGDLETFISK